MYDASCMATLRGNFNVHLSAYVGAYICDASRLRNCENSAEYINRSHEWKASVPIYPQKMRTGRIFQLPVQLFFFQYYSQALSVRLFMIGQLLIARPIVAIVLDKAAIFHCEVEWA